MASSSPTRTIGWVLLLVGTPVAAIGLTKALVPIAQMYRQATIDPLADAMPSDGQEVATRMIVPGAIGVAGGLAASVGSVLLLATKRRGRGQRV